MGRPRIFTDEERRQRKTAVTRAWSEANPGYNKAWREANRGREAAYAKVYRQANPERIAAYNKAWQEANPGYNKAWFEANRERKTATNRAWKEANPGYDKAWYQANRERRIAYAKAWKEANPDANREGNRRGWAKRRARILNAFVEPVDYDAVFVRDGGVCQICDTFIGDEKWHIDHRIPLSKGGAHSYANCQLAHARCNLSKQDKDPNNNQRTN